MKAFIWVSLGVAATCLLSLIAKDRFGVPAQRDRAQATSAGARKFLKKKGPAHFVTGTDGSGTGILGLTATNKYSSSFPVDVSMYPWDLVVEPYRDTTLTVQTSSDLDVTSSSVVVTWSITGPSTTSFSYTGVGASVVVQFTGVGHYELLVSVTDTETATTYSYGARPMNKYVRREIRSLDDDDREALLDALHTVYTVSTEEGSVLYGPSYKDMAWFVKKHLYGAADRECDHWHDDAGIVNHHVAYTLELEQVLQAIDPSVSVPYWEYTIDAQLDSWEDSVIFDDDWFGKASPTSDDHVVTEGRWAYTPILSSAESFSRAHNPYGLLRSPWNTNPTPYFTRNHYIFGTESFYWPACSHFSDCYNSSSFAAISLCLNGYTHGPVHIKIGGEWGISQEDQGMAQDYNFLVPFLLLVKNLWRHGVVSCPTDCTGLSEGETCECGLTDGILEKKSAYQILSKYTGILYQMTSVGNPRIYWDADADRYRVRGVSAEAEEAFWSKILHALSSPHQAGEMYTSAAPYDPTFWVIHPTAERLLNAKRISVALRGTEFDDTWSYDHVHKAASDSGQVCVWSDVEEGDLPMCVKMLCDGHHEYDILPFSKLRADKQDLLYTNGMMYEFIHPYNDDLPYLYDNYRWDHCQDTYPIVI